jgi:hypothetical protein
MDKMSQFQVTSCHIHFQVNSSITLHLYMGDALIKSILTGCFVIFLSFQANARIITQLGHYLFFSNPFHFTNHHVTETIQSEIVPVS